MLRQLKSFTIVLLLVAVQASGTIPLEDIKDLDLTNPGYGDLNPLHGLVWNEGILENHGELLPEGNTLRKLILLLFHRTGTFDPSTQPDTNSVVPYLTRRVIGEILGALKNGNLAIDKIVIVPSGTKYVIPRKYRNNLGTWLNELRNDSRAYRVMLALLWYKAESKKDFEEYYDGVRAWNSDAVKRIPEGWLAEQFTSRDAQSEQPPPIKNYDAFLYWMMKRLSDAPPLEHQGTSYVPESLADCGETSLKNFLKLAIDQNGTYNVRVLKSLGAKQSVIDFFTRFSTRQEQTTQEARDAWAKITMNLEQVVYAQEYNGKKFEIRASKTNASQNMLAVLRALFTKLKDINEWEEVGQKIEEARKQTGLGNFQIEETNLSQEGYGEVIFAVDKLGRFNWFFQAGHFYVDSIFSEQMGKYPQSDNQDIAIFYNRGPGENDTWYLYLRLRRNETILLALDFLEASDRLDANILASLLNRLSTDDARERLLLNPKYRGLLLEVFAHKNFRPSEAYLYIFLGAKQFDMASKLAVHKYFVEQGTLFVGHTGMVDFVAFSQDGTKVVTASRDGTARIWNAKTGELIRTLQEGGQVYSAVFSRDGKKILTANYRDHHARIWDAETGKVIHILKGHTAGVFSAAFSRDGTKVVTASNDKTARIWNAETGQEVSTLKGHTDTVKTAVFNHDGTRVLTASWDKTARIWDAVSGKEIRIFKGHTNRVASAVFSPDDLRVLTASTDKTIRIWNASDGKQMKSLAVNGALTSAVFSRYGNKVLAVVTGGNARVLSTTTGEEIRVIKGRHPFTWAVYSPDGTKVLTASGDSTARIWN